MQRRVQNNKFLAGFLAVLTAFSPAASVLPVYAADRSSSGITVEDSTGISVSGNSGIVLSSDYADGGSAIVIEDEAEEQNTLSLKLSFFHGELVVKDAGTEDEPSAMREQHIRLVRDAESGKVLVSVRDKDGRLTSETILPEDTDTVLVLRRETGTVVSVEAAADDGYDVSKYAVSVDAGGEPEAVSDGIRIEGSGEPAVEVTNFRKDTYVSFTYPVILDGNKTIEVDFEALSSISVEGVSGITVDEESQEKGTGTVVTESDLEKESEAVDPKDGEPSGFSASHAFETMVPSAKDYDIGDFVSARLLVLASDSQVFLDPENIIGTYGDLYLLQYNTPEQARNAYVYYLGEAQAVEPDVPILAADNDGTGAEEPAAMTAEENPLTAASESEDVVLDGNMVVALVDTGVTDEVPVVDRVSVLDEALYSRHPHGNEMAKSIRKWNPDAEILSVRALDDNGEGTVSSIAAGIKYAMDHDAAIINLSLSARKTPGTSVLEAVIQEAISRGILVVGSAGNYGRDAAGYVPGFIYDAYIIGACDVDGKRISTSNYGLTVDYNMNAASTSEAAALFSGYLSLKGTVWAEDLNRNGLYLPGYGQEAEPEVPEPSGDAVENPETGDVVAILDSDAGLEDILTSLNEGSFEDLPDLEGMEFELPVLTSYDDDYFHADVSLPVTFGPLFNYDGWCTCRFWSAGFNGYCLSPPAATPGAGTYPAVQMANSSTFSKLFYRFDVRNDWSGMDVSGSVNSNNYTYSLLHAALSKAYGSAGWSTGLSSASVNRVNQMFNLANASAPAASGTVNFSSRSMKAKISTDGEKQVTNTIVFTTDSGNAVISIPEGVTLVNETNGGRSASHPVGSAAAVNATLVNGDRFHFEAPTDQYVRQGERWVGSATATGNGYAFYAIQTGAYAQDIATYRTVAPVPTTLTVEWLKVGWIQVTKERDRGVATRAANTLIGGQNLFAVQSNSGGGSIGGTSSDAVGMTKDTLYLIDRTQANMRVDIVRYKADGTWEIPYSFNEGLLGFADGSWGFCGDVDSHFHAGAKTARNAADVYGEDAVRRICARMEWINQNMASRGCLSDKDLYSFYQICVWSVVNGDTYAGCRFEYGNNVRCSCGEWISKHISDLHDQGFTWADAHKNEITPVKCLYWDGGDGSQPLTTWSWSTTGAMTVTKARATRAGMSMCDINYLLGGEAIYGRQGAVYQIKAANGQIVDTLTTGTNGVTPKSKELPPGQYTVTETKAPKNYVLNTDNSKIVTVTAGQVVNVTFTNTIEGDPANLVMFKHQNGTRGNDLADIYIGPQGDSSWADVQFRIYYFNTEADMTLAQAKARVAANNFVEAWDFRMSDQKIGPYNLGMMSFRNTNYIGNVKGLTDPAFEAVAGMAQFPIGKFLIVETKSPKGFILGDVALLCRNVQVSDNIEDMTNQFQFLESTYDSALKAGDTFGMLGAIVPSEVDYHSNVIMLAEEHDRYGLQMQKADRDSGTTERQGDSDWSGIHFEITNASVNPVVIDGQTFAPGQAITNVAFVTDANGYARTAAVLPQGTYTVKEVSRSDDKSYEQTDGRTFTYTLHDSDDGTRFQDGDIFWDDDHDANQIATFVSNEVVRAGLSVDKIDFMLGNSNAHGDTDLSGAQFTILNASDRRVTNKAGDVIYGTIKDDLEAALGADGIAGIEAKSNASSLYQRLSGYAKDNKDNSVLDVITTDGRGHAETAIDLLPFGTYYIIETKAPTGYRLNDDWVAKVVVRDNNKNRLIDVTSAFASGMGVTVGRHEQPEQIWRGGVHVRKFDLMRDDDRAHGDAVLGTAEFTIINASESPAMNKDGQVIPTSKVTDGDAIYAKLNAAAKVSAMQVITTGRNGEASTGKYDLPYGTYYVIETKAPAGYFLNTDWVGKVVVREDGTVYDVRTIRDQDHDEYNHTYYPTIGRPAITEGDDYAVRDQIYRSGINLQKIDLEMKKQTAQGESVLSGAEFTILNASDASIRNKERHDIETCKGQLSAKPTYAELRAIADAGTATVQVITTNSQGFVTAKTTDLPYGTYYVIETKASYGYFIDDGFVGKVVIRSDGDMLSLGESANGSSFVDINDTGARTVDQQERRANLYMLKVNIDGNYKPYIPFLISAVRLQEDGTETVLESHVMVTDENGMLTTARVPRNPLTLNGMDQYVQEKAITAEGEKHLREAAEWGVWFQGNSDNYPKDAANDTYGALYTGHYRITELQCEDNKDKDENLLASDLVYVYNDTVEQDEVMVGGNDDLVIHHPLVDTAIQIRSAASDTESGTKVVPARDSVDVQDYVEFNHVSADHTYRMETQWVDLTNGWKPIKILGTTDDYAELSRDALWVTKEFSPKQQADTNNTYDNVTMYATINTKALNGHRIMAIDYLYEYIDVTLNDKVYGDWVLVAKHPRDIEVIEDETLYIPDLHTNARDSQTDTRVGVKSEEAGIYDTVEFKNLSDREAYVIQMGAKDTDTGEWLSVDGDGNPAFVTSKTIFRRGTSPVEGAIEMPELKLDTSGFTEGRSVTVVEYLYRATEDGEPMGEPLMEHDSLLDENQTIRYIDMDSQEWDVRTSDDVGTVEAEAVVYDTVNLHNVILENRADGSYTYEVQGSLVYQKDYTDRAGVSHKAGDPVELLEGTQDLVRVVADADGNATFTYGDGSEAEGRVRILRHGFNLAHVVDEGLVGDNSYIEDRDTAIADVSVTMAYRINAALLEDATVVSFAVLNHDAVLSGMKDAPQPNLLERFVSFFRSTEEPAVTVSRHEDLLDPDQTVHFPKVRTSAIDTSTKDDVGAVRDDAVIVDTVQFWNLVPGREYSVRGTLMDQETGREFLLNGHPVVKQAHLSVTADGEVQAPNGEKVTVTSYDPERREVSGTVDLTFTLNASALEGKSLVAFEDLIHNGIKVATHSDILDKNQTVHFPKIRTSNKDGYTKDHVSTVSKDAVIVDTVKYENLVPGKEYTMNGTLMNKNTGERLVDASGNPVHASRTFVAGEEGDGLTVTDRDNTLNRVSGTVDITFRFDATLLEGTTAVAFEELKHNDITVTTHTNLQDEEQSVHFPRVRTSALDVNTTDEVGVVGETAITDTVRLWNLVPGQAYTVNGVLMDKDEKAPLLVNGEEIRRSATVRITEDGRVDTSVSRECTCGNPKACTCGHGSVRITSWNTDMRSVDAFVNLTFELDASLLEGKTTVVFEDLVHNDTIVASHADLDDLGQTVHFPKIRTHAVDGDTDDHAGTVGTSVTIRDAVSYENLVIGRTYTLKGTLMDQATGNPLLGMDGLPVTASANFTVVTESEGNNTVLAVDERNQVVSGSYLLTFTLDSRLLAGKTVVVFEDLYHNDKKVTTHSDINDKDQSVHYPEIHTMATDSSTGDHVGTLWGRLTNTVRQWFGETDADGNGIPDDRQQNIVDTVELINLVPGYTYVVSGQLYDVDASHEKGTPVPLLIDGEAVTEAVTIVISEDGKSITATNGARTTVSSVDTEHGSVDGTVELTYVLDGSKVSGKELVVFEDLYHDGTYGPETVPTDVELKDLVHRHHNIDDKDQSISEVSVHTTAVDETTGGSVGSVAGEHAMIRDLVVMTKLIPGMEYKLEGVLVDADASDFAKGHIVYLKFDGSRTEDRAEAVTQSLLFTAAEANESHELRFSVEADKMQGRAVTVFEDLYHNDVKIAVHPALDEDGGIAKNDFASQTIHYPTGKTNATDDVTGLHTSYAGKRTITDRVYFENLLVGETYEIKGQLAYQAGFTDGDGQPHEAGELLEGVTAGVRFEAREDLETVLVTEGVGETAAVDTVTAKELANGRKVISGYVSLTFEVDASKLAGATLVAFESFYQNGVPIFTHQNLEDYPQTVRIPRIRTNANFEILDDADVHDENGNYRDITITDTVSYQNLWTNEQLAKMKEDGKFIQYGDGSVRDDGHVIYDIDEAGTYLLQGVLMDKETGEAVTNQAGDTYTVFSEPFTPETSDGTVDVQFTINAGDFLAETESTLEGKTLVVFEDLYQADKEEDAGEGTLVASHHDIEDEAQSVAIPKIRTRAAVEGAKRALAAQNMSVRDTVTYENLVPGKTYVMKGVLMDKATGESTGLTGEQLFVPEEADGTVTVDFLVPDGTAYNDKELVVFETLLRMDEDEDGIGEGHVVAEHHDIDDEAQAVFIEKVPEIPVEAVDTGEHAALGFAIGGTCFLLLLAALFLRKRRGLLA